MKRLSGVVAAALLAMIGVYFSYALSAGYLPLSFPEPFNFVAGGILLILVLLLVGRQLKSLTRRN